jgi:hypothetical protein
MRPGLLTRREMLVRTGEVLAALGVAAACGPITPLSNSGPAASATAAPSQPKSGGALVVGQFAPIATTNPYPPNNASNIFRFCILEPLVRLDAAAQPLPHLADS